MKTNNTSRGWFAVHRGEELELLQEHYPDALLLLLIIASRARLTPCPIRGLEIGEAFLGDFKKAGMTESRYRTALTKLNKLGFITSQGTNRGTIAKLVKPTIVDPLSVLTNGQDYEPVADKYRATNDQLTTKNNGKKEKNVRKEELSFTPPNPQGGEVPGADDVKELAKKIEPLLVEAWNALPSPIRKVRGKVPSPCRRAFLARLKDPDWLADWEEALASIPDDPHCLGDNDRGWVATMEYFLRPDTVEKLLSRKAARDMKHSRFPDDPDVGF